MTSKTNKPRGDTIGQTQVGSRSYWQTEIGEEFQISWIRTHTQKHDSQLEHHLQGPKGINPTRIKPEKAADNYKFYKLINMHSPLTHAIHDHRQGIVTYTDTNHTHILLLPLDKAAS